MRHPELAARWTIAVLMLATVGLPLVFWSRTTLVHARMADDGGWKPYALRATVGEPLRLNLTSDDVIHGFAVGHLDQQAVDILPGKVTSINLFFREPGTYTFYCTRWCGLNHWRMRGTIEVEGKQGTAPPSPNDARPLYVALGLDLDAPRAALALPARKPVAALVDDQLRTNLESYAGVDYYRSHSPYELWRDLRQEPYLSGRDDQGIWDLAAAIWRLNTNAAQLAQGSQLFAQNCAACHGETGAADGVFADDLASGTVSSMGGGAGMIQAPADLSDPSRILAASPALLQGKIVRGGMGTGMPSWGPILTEEQTWSLVAYLYSLQFDDR